MFKIKGECSEEELDIVYVKKIGGWVVIKREMIVKKDEKRKFYRGWYVNRVRKLFDEDMKFVNSSLNFVDYGKQI